MSRTNDYERRSTYSGPSTGRRDTHLQIRPEHESRLTDDTAPRLCALNIPCPTAPSLVPGRDVCGYALPHQHRRPRCCLEHIVHTLHETVNTHPSRSLQEPELTSILSAEHSLYARAPIAFATRCASAVVTNDPGGTFAPTFHACTRGTESQRGPRTSNGNKDDKPATLQRRGRHVPSGGRRSDLQPTRMTGMVGPQIERTSSIHCVAYPDVSKSREGGGRQGERVRGNAYLHSDVLERVRGVNGECDEDNM